MPVPSAKCVALDEIEASGMRIVAVVDNEPENLAAMAASNAAPSALFLHADTIFESQRGEGVGVVTGSAYELEDLISEDRLREHVELIWHGVNDQENLDQFLESGITWAEVDVRCDPVGRLVLRHDGFDERPWARHERALPARPTVETLVNAGRSIKLDVKENGETLLAVSKLIEGLGLDDDRVWFNAEIQVVGAAGFEVFRERHPDATASCPIDFLGPLLEVAHDEADIVLARLRSWGVTRLSVRWGRDMRRTIGALEQRGLGDEHLCSARPAIVPGSRGPVADLGHRGLQLPLVALLRSRLRPARRRAQVCRGALARLAHATLPDMTRQHGPGGAAAGGKNPETATQTLHRLTSYEPGREWDEPVDDPRVVQDLEVNDLGRFPWFFKRYAQSLPRVRASSRPADHDGSGRRRARGHRGRRPHRARPAAALPVAPPVRRGGAHDGAAVHDLAVPRRRVRGRPLPARAVRRRARGHVGRPRACTGTTRRTTPWCRSGRRRAAARPPSSSPASRGAPDGATASADTGTCIGTPAPCSPSCSPWPTPRGSPPGCSAAFPDAAVAALVGADGVHEWPVAVVALGDGPPALDATGPAASGDVDAAPVEFPLVTAAQRAGERDALGQPWDRGAPVDVPRTGSRPGRDRRARTRLAAPHGPHARAAGERAAHIACSRRCAASISRTSSWCTTSRDSRRVCTAGRTSRPRCAPARCETSSTGCASSRDSLATRRSS